MTSNICRVCFTKESLINVFRKSGHLMISTKLMSLAKVHVTPEDGLPTTICTKCVQRIEDCLEFIKLCETSDTKLRSLILEKIEKENCVTDIKTPLNYIFISEDNENSLSPSETERELHIDESLDCYQTSIDDNSKDDSELLLNCNSQTNKDSKKSSKQQCVTCGKVMSSRFRLKTHMRIHTGERPFACPHCNKKFSLAQSLKVHIRIHTGEKPLQCSVCGESFAQSAGLAAHKRKHTGQMPYSCVLCPRAFRTVGHLQYHLRRHTGEKRFECDTCGRAFITRSDLKQHFLTHSGDRPHVCCICGLRMTRASHLKRHIRIIHNTIKNNSLSCEHCELKFVRKIDLEEHAKQHNSSIENT